MASVVKRAKSSYWTACLTSRDGRQLKTPVHSRPSLARFGPPLAVFGLWLVLFVIGITGYPNLLDNERRIGAYALDVMQNGNWIAQHDSTGEFMSKPPGLTWLVVLFCYGTGGLSRFSLYLPSALATLGVAFLIFYAARRHFTERAALISALIYLLSYVADKQLTSARYDGLFTFPVFLGALSLYHGWREGRGWLMFWIAMTFGCMVKGPLVFVLPVLGLTAVLLEKNTGQLFRWHWHHALGLIIFTAVCGAWLAQVLHYHGDEFINKMLRHELVGHALNDGGKHVIGERFYSAPLYVITQFLPWSPIAGLAAARFLRRTPPQAGQADHSLERYLSCYFAFGLLLFALAAHQRGRLTWPLIPALALLAGRQLDIWLRNFSDRQLYRWAAALAAVVIIVSALGHHLFMRYSSETRQTLASKQLASRLEQEMRRGASVVYVDAPFAVQFYLQRLEFNVSGTAAAEQLRKAEPVYVVASRAGSQRVARAMATEFFTVYAWPSVNAPRVKVLSNRQTLAP